MWNDTDSPLAYLITFRTYGTWLHGDERGSIDRFNNQFNAPKIPPTTHWNDISSARLKHKPVILDAAMRRSVDNAIRDTCSKRDWALLALNVRTNHGHVVVRNAGFDPLQALVAFKANATRQMREDVCWPNDHSPWSTGGSKRLLWNDDSIGKAIFYVVNEQGEDLPEF